jgi:hypothetical protein
MATFILKLDGYTLRKLADAARNAGVAPERMAAMALEAWILADDGQEHRSPGVSEPAHAFTDGTNDGDPGQYTAPDDDEGPFVELDVTLDALSAARIMARANLTGIAPEELAVVALDSRFFDYDDFEWPDGGDPRTAGVEPIVEEELRDWKDVRPELEAYLEERLKARR